RRQRVRPSQQLERLLPRLAQVEPGVDDDAFGRDAGRFGATGAIGEELADRGYDVAVTRLGVRNPWLEADVGGDHRGTRLRAHVQVVGVGEAADVVADLRAGRIGGARHLGPPGVDRDRDVEPRPDRRDGRNDAIELLGLAHVLTRA